jgi:hypothetical protein
VGTPSFQQAFRPGCMEAIAVVRMTQRAGAVVYGFVRMSPQSYDEQQGAEHRETPSKEMHRPEVQSASSLQGA